MTVVEPAGYTLQRKLGEGASATVYAAEDRRLGRQVALKLISFDRFQQDSARRVLIQEAQALAQIRSPYVARVFDVCVESNGAWLVMELIPGNNLRTVLATNRIPAGRALLWMQQLAGAVEAIAVKGLVHRDIKPANIIMTRDFDISLVDLGVAVSASRQAGAATAGTPAYMSPEQTRGEPPTPKCDVYAYGLVAFELLTGHHPFEADLRSGTVREAHGSKAAPHVRSLAPQTPRWTDKLIDRALKKDPRKRPSIREIRWELEKHR